MQFLLGVDAPVSFLLLRADPRHDPAQRAHRAAGLRARAPLAAAGRCPRTRAGAGAAPTRPAACRRCTPRLMTARSRRRAPPADHPAARAARRGPRRHRASCCSRSSSSASGTCRCSPATSTWRRRASNRVRERARPGAARRDRRPQRQRRSSRTARPPSSQLDPARLPAAERDAAATWGQRVTARSRRPQGPARDRDPDPAAADRRSCATRYERLGTRARHVGQDDPAARRAAASCTLPYADVTVKTDVPALVSATTSPSAPSSSPASTSRRSTCATTPTGDAGRAAARHDRRDQRRRSSSTTHFKGVAAGHDRRQGRARVRVRPATCAAATARRASQVDALGQAPRARRPPARAGARAQRCALSLDLGLQQAGAERARGHRPGRGTAGRRSSRSNPRNGEVYAMGSSPTLQPGDPRQARSPAGRYDALFGDGARRAAVQPRDRRRLSDRLDLQADHRAGGARAPASSRRATSINDTGCIKIGARRQTLQRRQGGLRAGQHARRAAGLVGHLLLHAGPALYSPRRPAAAEVGARPRPRAPDRDRHCPARPAASCPTALARSRAAGARERSVPQAASTTVRQLLHRRHPRRGPRATTSTSPSARATCRPRRCRWRSPTRRSPTAAASCARTSALQIEDRGGALLAEDRAQAPRAASRSTRPTARRSCDGLHARRQRAGGTSSRRVRRAGPTIATRSSARPAPPSASRQDDQSWYVAYVDRRPSASRSSSRSRSRSGGFGAEAAAPVGAPDPVASGSTSSRSASAGARTTR